MDSLPAELVLKVFKECQDIRSVINLSETSKRYHTILNGTQMTAVFLAAAEVCFSPLEDAIQLVTYDDSQVAHEIRDPVKSMTLIKQLVRVGNLANDWLKDYPELRWRSNTASRRFLRPHEVFRFRRAFYRFWLYAKAFHSIGYLTQDEDPPMATGEDDRLTFLRRFTYDQLAEICEVNDVFYEMLYNDICPSNTMVKNRYLQAVPGHKIFIFGNYQTFSAYGYTSMEDVSIEDLPKGLAKEAWGSKETQLRIVDDCLKLTPDELFHLRQLDGKVAREQYLNHLHPLFHHNDSTLRNALEAVFAEKDIMFGGTLDADGGIIDFLDEGPRDHDGAGDLDDEDSDDEDCGENFNDDDDDADSGGDGSKRADLYDQYTLDEEYTEEELLAQITETTETTEETTEETSDVEDAVQETADMDDAADLEDTDNEVEESG